MGNTCSSVHIALTGTTPDAIEGIVRAYTTLGFEQTKTASPEGGKHVILLRQDGDVFLSVYDSDNAALDTGELKDLALAASKIFKTAAVCTSLYDSDTFEIVVFNRGKQVDLVMSDPAQYNGPLKALSDASRAAQWSKVFGKSLSVERITQATTRHSAFADDALAELSRVIGLTGGQSQLHYHDLSEDATRTRHLHFIRRPSASRAVPEGQIVFRNYFDPDNSRMLLVYPASWPVPLVEEVRVTWLMLSEGVGFNDGTLAIHVNGPEGLAITRGYMEGSKFHNGQIVGPLETAPRDTTGATAEDLLESRQFEVTQVPSGASQSKTFTARFPPLDIPTKEPARPTQILVVLQLHLAASHVGVWDIDVSVQPASRSDFQHHLPRARLAAVEQTWLPVVSGLNAKTSYETGDLATLQPRGPLMLHELQRKQAATLLDRTLNHSAIASNVAILQDDGQATLDACRSYLEAWLRPMAEQIGEIRIHAEKRMTERAYVGKSRKTLPVSAFQGDKAWRKLFDNAGNYQTVLASIFPKDAEYPIAGVGLQVGLEHYPEQWREHYEQQLADTLSTMRGRRFDTAPVVNTVHVFNWVLNHADCYKYMGTSIADLKDRIDEFAAQHAVLQAWHSQCTWHPLFDHADDYHRTVYEEHSVLNWFRGILQTDSGLNSSKMSLQWCRNVLRMVTPHLWVCRALLEQVDRAALEAVAQVTETNDASRLRSAKVRGSTIWSSPCCQSYRLKARECISVDQGSCGAIVASALTIDRQRDERSVPPVGEPLPGMRSYFRPSFFPQPTARSIHECAWRASPVVWRYESTQRSYAGRWAPAPGKTSTRWNSS
jgi:hypothetical protein